jgi:hypothetical protein
MLRWQRRLDSAEEALRTEPCWPRTLSSEPRHAWMGRGAARGCRALAARRRRRGGRAVGGAVEGVRPLRRGCCALAAAGRVLVVKPMYNNDMGNDQEQVGAGSATGETGPA